MTKIKGLGRSYPWWPQMDKDIERTVKGCDGCQRVANNPSQVPLHRWEYPAAPWQRLHIDFAGPFQGCMLLVVVDASTKWPEITLMKNTTAEETVKTLRTLLARMGLPQQIVSDNGPQFTSDVFKRFVQSNGIRHIMGAPYHPATNGLAERLVPSFKNAVKADLSDRDLQHKLDRFLMAYRASPHATTEQSPAQLLMGRSLKTRLDLLRPNVKRRVDKRLFTYETKPMKEFSVGDKVWARNFVGGIKWVPGEVVKQAGPVLYHVSAKGMVLKRHADQLRARVAKDGDVSVPESVSSVLPPSDATGTVPAIELTLSEPRQAKEEAPDQKQDTPATVRVPSVPEEVPPTVKTTRSGRAVRTPSRFNDYDL